MTVQVVDATENGNFIALYEQTTTAPFSVRFLLGGKKADLVNEYRGDGAVPIATQDCLLNVQLNDTTGVVDTGRIPVTWDPTSGLGNLIAAQVPVSGQGGLTDTQAQQLQDLHIAAFPVLNLDGLALTDLTEGIPSSGFQAGLASSLNGVIVRISSIPAGLVPIQGDPNYWRQTLAQVSIYRANDLWLRFPVHSQSRMFLLPGSETASGIASDDLTAWLLNMHLVLTTFPGVLAEVFLMHTP